MTVPPSTPAHNPDFTSPVTAGRWKFWDMAMPYPVLLSPFYYICQFFSPGCPIIYMSSNNKPKLLIATKLNGWLNEIKIMEGITLNNLP